MMQGFIMSEKRVRYFTKNRVKVVYPKCKETMDRGFSVKQLRWFTNDRMEKAPLITCRHCGKVFVVKDMEITLLG